MSDNNKSLRKHIIRLTLVTGSTVATIIGAQSLATIDQQSLQADIAAANPNIQATVEPATAVPEAQLLSMATATPHAISLITASNTPTETASPTMVQIAPRITILRGANDASPIQQPVVNAAVQIAPPAPVEIAPPPAIVIQNTPQVIIEEVQAPPPPSSSGGSSSSNSAPAPRSSSSR